MRAHLARLHFCTEQDEAHTLESGQKYNSQAFDRSTIKRVGDCWDENVVNESNLLELLVTTAEQMTVSAHSSWVNSADLLWAQAYNRQTKIATDSFPRRSKGKIFM